MERDPRGGEAKKASPGYIPSESEIDDLLWTTHGINPRRQKEYKPLTKDDIQNMSLEEMNASGGTWSRLSAAQACCKRSDNLHASPAGGDGGGASGGRGKSPKKQGKNGIYRYGPEYRSIMHSDKEASLDEVMTRAVADADDQHDREELRKRLAKHFTAKSAKKQKPAEK